MGNMFQTQRDIILSLNNYSDVLQMVLCYRKSVK
jgi:hypothetical protein